MIKNYIFDIPSNNYNRYDNHGDGNCGTSDFSGRGYGGGEDFFGKGSGFGLLSGDGTGEGDTITELFYNTFTFSLPSGIGKMVQIFQYPY